MKKTKSVEALKVTYVKPSKLKPWKKNPRRNDEAAEKLAELFDQFGFVVPIIATRDGIIRAGHTRWKAARRKGFDKVPVIYVDFGGKEEAEMFSIADNKSSEWAEWDETLLQEIFGSIPKSPDILSRMSGFTEREIEGLSADMGSYAADSFRDLVEKFEGQNPEKAKTDPFWAWFILPDEETMNWLKDNFALDNKPRGRELDWKKLRKRLKAKPKPKRREM